MAETRRKGEKRPGRRQRNGRKKSQKVAKKVITTGPTFKKAGPVLPLVIHHLVLFIPVAGFVAVAGFGAGKPKSFTTWS
jgi:hypothetical protein